MSSNNNILTLLQKEITKRLNNEGIHRIKICLSKLTENQVWHKANTQTNSIGNLILHLEGNVNQWLIATFDDVQDKRNRAKEFDLSSQCSKQQLLDILHQLEDSIERVAKKISLDQLHETFFVQCFEEVGLSIVVHVIEHFSYHVGQISLQTKLLVNEDLGYYTNLNLDKTKD